MKLTIGMATYDDFDGVYFTVQALRMYHPGIGLAGSEFEILIVDNHPDSQHGRLTANFAAHAGRGVRYVPMPEPVGTAPPRNRVFEEAKGDFVLCIDSHILLHEESVLRLMKWCLGNRDCDDLLSGPMIGDNLKQCTTHMTDSWLPQTWGAWGSDPRGQDSDAPPFEINAMGLGVFACRKEAWLGFNPHFRQFGGEENYIHVKYRQAGRRCLCLPFLRWTHRFYNPEIGRPGGIPYPYYRWNKVRNYVLGFQELGLDLQPVYDTFIASGLLPQWQWDYLLADPVGRETVPKLSDQVSGMAIA